MYELLLFVVFCALQEAHCLVILYSLAQNQFETHLNCLKENDLTRLFVESLAAIMLNIGHRATLHLLKLPRDE